MAARSCATASRWAGEGRTGCRPRRACPAANLLAGTDLRACVRLILRCAGAGPRVLARRCLRDELPAVPGRSYWRVVLDFVAFPTSAECGERTAGVLPGVAPGRAVYRVRTRRR